MSKAINYKKEYEEVKWMLKQYQDRIVPSLYKQLETRVEVIRCKDCRHYQRYGGSMRCLYKFGLVSCDENSFCSYGERREGE